MNDDRRFGWSISPQVVFGIAIVLFGLLLTAGNLGLAPNATRIFRFWPMVFTFVGLSMALCRDSSSSRKLFGWLLVIGGVWQTANTAFGFGVYIDEWWPLLLVAGGVLLVMRAVQRQNASASSSSSTLGNGAGASAAGDNREDQVTSFAVMSGVKRVISSPGFRRADLTAMMGGVELDLRQCTASGGESIIDVFAMWGGIQIRVPSDWQVVSDVTPIMGGVDDRSGHVQPARHRLVLKGMVVMGGVEVKS